MLALVHYTNSNSIQSIKDIGFNKSINESTPNKAKWLGNGVYFFTEKVNELDNYAGKSVGIGLVRFGTNKDAPVSRIMIEFKRDDLNIFNLENPLHLQQIEINLDNQVSRLSNYEKTKHKKRYQTLLGILSKQEPFTKHKEEFGYFLGQLVDNTIEKIKGIDFNISCMRFAIDDVHLTNNPSSIYGNDTKLLQEFCLKNLNLLPVHGQWSITNVD